MKYILSSRKEQCKRCLYRMDHPLGLHIDSEGICSGCRVHEEKNEIDWTQRWEDLRKLVEPYRKKTGSHYDCIVPVSGANDSYFIVHVVKNLLGLNPLLVTHNKYFNTNIGIENLANLRTVFDCDLVMQNINPKKVKNITRTTLREFGSIYWTCIAGQTVFPVQTAARFRIPLIIWGAHQGLEQVGMFSHLDDVEMTRRYRSDHDLLGMEADDLLSIFDTLKEDDIWQFRYPEEDALRRDGTRGIYLGNFIRWDPKAQHELMIEKYGYKSASFNRTFETYDHVDCFNYLNLHDTIKLYKHGYSKVTDTLCREIRHGRVSRTDALKIEAEFMRREPNYVDLFCDWLDIEVKGLNFVLGQHINKEIWGEDTRLENISIDNPGLNSQHQTLIPDEINFGLKKPNFINSLNGYTTIGKGV